VSSCSTLDISKSSPTEQGIDILLELEKTGYNIACTTSVNLCARKVVLPD
jgi:hypothetical protein